jgi:hypothetical protein
MGLFTRMRMKEPVRGRAQVVSATANRGDSSWQDIRMTLTVRAEGVPPTAVEHRCMCRADRWPSPGDVLPVTVDARRPKRLKVEWDEVESARDRAWTTAQALAAQQPDAQAADAQAADAQAAAAAGVDIDALRRAFPGATIDVQSYGVDASDQPDVARQLLAALQSAGAVQGDVQRPAGTEDEAAERIANLERLAKLRESGALNDAEFEAEKARILRGD